MATRDDMIDLARPWIRLLFWVLVVTIVVFAFSELTPLVRWVLGVFQPFLIALIVAYVFHPIVTFVQKTLRLGRVTGIFLLGLTIAGVFIGVTIWLVPVLGQEIASVQADFTHMPATIKAYMIAFNEKNPHFFSTKGIEDVYKSLNNIVDVINVPKEELVAKLSAAFVPAAQGGMSAVQNVAGGVLGGLRAVTVFLITTGFVVLISFYYLVSMDAFPHIIRRLLPVKHRETIWLILLKADRSVGGFLRGQLIACLIVSVLTSILLFFVGMREYAILIGSFAGLMHMVPYLGPIAGGTPALLFVLLSQQFTTLSQRGFYALIILIGFSFIETFDGLVTQPFIVGKRASLHPLAVLLALVVGAQFGLSGMIIAVPSMCFARVLWMELFWKNRHDDPMKHINIDTTEIARNEVKAEVQDEVREGA